MWGQEGHRLGAGLSHSQQSNPSFCFLHGEPGFRGRRAAVLGWVSWHDGLRPHCRLWLGVHVSGDLEGWLAKVFHCSHRALREFCGGLSFPGTQALWDAELWFLLPLLPPVWESSRCRVPRLRSWRKFFPDLTFTLSCFPLSWGGRSGWGFPGRLGEGRPEGLGASQGGAESLQLGQPHSSHRHAPPESPEWGQGG